MIVDERKTLVFVRSGEGKAADDARPKDGRKKREKIV
jgi:hypothetical protein